MSVKPAAAHNVSHASVRLNGPFTKERQETIGYWSGDHACLWCRQAHVPRSVPIGHLEAHQCPSPVSFINFESDLPTEGNPKPLNRHYSLAVSGSELVNSVNRSVQLESSAAQRRIKIYAIRSIDGVAKDAEIC